MSSPLHVLQRSPHDSSPCATTEEDEVFPQGVQRWRPSRYTLRALSDDGRLILWNTLRGKLSVFRADQRATVEKFLKKGVEGREEGVIGQLASRGFLVRDGVDEFRHFQAAFGRQHYRPDVLELILLASEDCNFRCHYCYEDFARGTMRPEVREGLKRLVHKRLDEGLRALNIGWFGGEPLYGWDAVAELAPYFQKLAKERSIFYKSNMTTNGYLLTPEIADKLLSWGVDKYQITIDGPPEHHDCSRPGRNGEKTFDTIFENLIAMKQRSDQFRIAIRVNFDKDNYPMIHRFLDLCEETFQSDDRFQLRFRAVGQWGGDNDENLNVCGEDESMRVVQEFRHEARKRGLVIADVLSGTQGLGSQVCYAARPYSFVVGASGKLMKCTIDLDKKDRNVVGKIEESGEMVLDDEKFALWTEPAFERDTKCQKCVILPACQGIHCPQIRFDTGDSPCTPTRRHFKHELKEVVRVTAPAPSPGAQPAAVAREAAAS